MIDDTLLISPEHKARYIEYYTGRWPNYRVIKDQPHRWQAKIEAIAEKVKAESVLDYGCGITQALSRHSSLPVTDYDPVIRGLDNPFFDRKFDVVVCNHVLEHVEPDRLHDILGHIKSLVGKVAYIALSTQLSTKKLPDGTEWHLIVHNKKWWNQQLKKHFREYHTFDSDERTVEILWVAK
jgi:hypothetical protein